MKIHELKTVQPFFDMIVDGSKTAEMRKLDRGFKPHDILILQEYAPYFDNHNTPIPAYSGREVIVIITSILHNHESLADGYGMISFKKVLERKIDSH